MSENAENLNRKSGFLFFLDIDAKEWPKAILMFCYFFLTIALVYILKSVQRSLFLNHYGAEKLSYAYMAEGIFLIGVVWLYSWFAKRVSKKIFYCGLLSFFIANLVILRALLWAHLPYVEAFFYVWHAAFSITMTTVFWNLANDLYSTHEAKRLFGFILSGGSLGGIFGGLMAKALMQWIKTEDLLLVSAGLLFLCLVFVWELFQRFGGGHSQASTTEVPLDTSGEASGQRVSSLKLFLSNKYLWCICLLVMLAKMGASIVDNQFNAVVAKQMTGKDEMTAFFGGFFSWLNTASFLMQLFATSAVLKFLGAGMGLFVLPIGLLLFGGINLAYPVLWAAILLRMFEGSTSVSIQQGSKEMLYLPVSEYVRRRTKPIIDMLGYRFAKTLGGIVIAVGLNQFHLPAERIAVLLAVVIPFWLAAAWAGQKIYKKVNLEEKTLKSH